MLRFYRTLPLLRVLNSNEHYVFVRPSIINSNNEIGSFHKTTNKHEHDNENQGSRPSCKYLMASTSQAVLLVDQNDKSKHPK